MDCLERAPERAYQRVVLVGRGNPRIVTLGGMIGRALQVGTRIVSSAGFDPDATDRLVVLDVGGRDAPQVHTLLEGRMPATYALFDLAPELVQARLLDRHGLRGVFVEKAPTNQILSGIDALLRGEWWLPRPLMAELIELRRVDHAPLPSGIWNLTPREQRVVQLLVDGASNKEIARALNLGLATIKSHLHKVYRKLGVANRLQAARSARDLRGEQ